MRMGTAAVWVSLFLAGSAPVWAQEPAAPAGPVSYWKFDETSGTTAANSVGGAPGGTYQGGIVQSTTLPPLITFPNVRSLGFNGTDSRLNVANFGTFTTASVAVWINRAATPATGVRQTVVSYKEAGGGGFVLSLNESASSGFPRIFFNVGGSGWQFRENPVAVPTDVWTHLAGTFDGTNIRLYVNGVESSPATAVAGAMTTPNATTGIGSRTTDVWWYPGLMDDVRIYSRALTGPEVAVLAAGCPVPTGLTAASGPANMQISLSWTAPAGAAPGYSYNVKRGTVSGTYTTIATGVPGTTYIDTVPTAGTPFFYVVSAVSAAESGNSAEASATVPTVTALPNTGLQTNEGGSTTTFNITYNAPAAAGSTVTVTSTDPGEGLVSSAGSPTPATSLSFPVTTGFTGVFTITVTGVGDASIDGNITYPISVTATNMGVTIPDVSVTNNDANVAGITFSRVGGLVTSENLTSDQFSVTLNTQPWNFIDLDLSSSNLGEGTVSPPLLRFTASGNPLYNPTTGTGDWNVAHVVTITGVDDSVLDFTVPYTIVTATLSVNHANDAPYTALVTPDVSVTNVDNETIPSLKPVWGGGDSGGCGLLGLELALPGYLLLRLRRRRRTI